MTEDTQRDPLRDHPPVSGNLIRNPISLIGLALAAVAFANIVLLALIDVLASQPSPYIGILAYMVAPGFLVLAERKRLIAELREANARLQTANEELALAGQLKSAFIEVASHE